MTTSPFLQPGQMQPDAVGVNEAFRRRYGLVPKEAPLTDPAKNLEEFKNYGLDPGAAVHQVPK